MECWGFVKLKFKITNRQPDRMDALEWRYLSHIGFSKYAVSNTGLLLTIKSGYTTPGSMGSHGYLRVHIAHDSNVHKTVDIHILIAKGFYGTPPVDSDHTVDHLDRNPINNNALNLKWVTKSEQSYNRVTIKEANKSKPITQMLDDGTEIFTWFRTIDAAACYNICATNIAQACKENRLVAGFRWKYCRNTLDGEQWTLILLSKFKYNVWVSNMGRFYTGNGRIGYGSNTVNGYKRIGIMSTDGSSKGYFVHRLIALGFLGYDTRLVNHKDGNSKNNKIENLEYATSQENAQHSVANKLQVAKKNGRASKQVNQLDLNGQVIETFPSINEAWRQTGIGTGHISEICRGVRRQEKGYTFKFVEDGYKNLH